MVRYWTCHWRNRFWRNDINREYSPCCSSGSNSFRKRGLSLGNVVYIVSMMDGQLLLGGRMTVNRIVSRNEAVQILGNGNLYDADEWIIDDVESGTPLNVHRRLASAVTRRLRFVVPRSEPRGLFFKSDAYLDTQATPRRA